MAKINQSKNNAREAFDLLNGNGRSISLQYPENVTEFRNWIQFERRDSRGNLVGNRVQLYIPSGVKQAGGANYAQEKLELMNAKSDFVENIDMLSGIAMDMDGARKLASNFAWMGTKLLSPITGGLVSNEGALANFTGAVFKIAQNPTLTFLYRSMDHRSFTYDFMFNCKNENETNNVRDIIKEFRLAQHPEAIQDTNDRFLRYPDTVGVSFGDEEYLYGHKECVITTVNTDYNAGGGAYSQFSNLAPTNISLSISFTELNILTKRDIENGM